MNNDPGLPPVRSVHRWFGDEGSFHTLLRYASVGAASALVELTLFQFLHSVAAMPLMMANVLAICGVMVFGFLGQKRFTFRNRDPVMGQAQRYVLLVASSFALNNALVYLFAILLAWPALIAKLLQLGLSFLFNFTVSRYFIFKHKNNDTEG